MSLNWSVGNIENFKEVCFIEDDTGARRLAPDTDVLIWATMAVDLGTISEKNIDEWRFRLAWLAKCGMDIATRFDENDQVVAYTPNVETIRKHINLSTNVSTITRRAFIAKVNKIITREIETDMRREDKTLAAEKEAAA